MRKTMVYSRRTSVLLLAALLLFLIFPATGPLQVSAAKHQEGWAKKDGKYYYYRGTGKKTKGMSKIDGKAYYFDKKGIQRTGWRKIDGDYYFFLQKNGKNGYMLARTTINGVKLKKNGKAENVSAVSRKLDLMTRCASIMDSLEKPAAKKEAKLSAAFAYVRDLNRRDIGGFVGGYSWDMYYAEYLLNRGFGDCFCQGALFAYMANAAGYSHVKASSSGGHGWAIVDGKYYDPNWANVIGTARAYGVPAGLSGVDGRPRWAQSNLYVKDLGNTAPENGKTSSAVTSRIASATKADQLAAPAGAKKGWNSSKTSYYVKKSGKLVKTTGLKKIKGSYYYFSKKGKLQKKKWVKNLKVRGRKYTFYFGKNGKAYTAKGSSGSASTQIIAKKIKGKVYGFDEKAHRVSGGLWATMKGKLYYFEKNGVYNADKTAVYSKVAKSGRTGKSLMDEIKSEFGEPKKISKTDSCNPFDYNPSSGGTLSMGNYSAWQMIYDNVQVILDRNDVTGVYYIEGVFPLDL